MQKEMLLQSVGRKEKSFFLQSVPIEEVLAKYPEPLYRIVPLDHVQLKMAEHMSRSAATSPHVTIVDEADVSLLILLYRKLSDGFEKKHGFKLTLTPFFAFAVVRALKEFPLLNSSLAGDKVVFKKYINLGIAVASPAGLLVPVIKYADEKNFLGLAQAIHDLTYRTRAKRLLPEDISGGTFSLTNYGVFGNIIGTPIINQPQAAIFGIGAVKKRPVVVENEGNDSIEIRSMLYLTLSFDHRFIDGATGGQFMARVRQGLEQMTENEVQ
jgi:2-oxoglutarate dehydrogenase E2 component (dihydrolipoamide succinyltransferase)